jgi:hypothetical protein
MSIKYSRQSATEYAVLHDGYHQVGVVQKYGMRWLAISLAHRSLGSFASMSQAGEKLVEQESKQ